MDSSISFLYNLLKNITFNNINDNIDKHQFIIDVNQLESPHTKIIFQLMIYDNYINDRIDLENITEKSIFNFVSNDGSKGVKFNIENIPVYLLKIIQLYIDISKSK